MRIQSFNLSASRDTAHIVYLPSGRLFNCSSNEYIRLELIMLPAGISAFLIVENATQLKSSS